MAKLPWLPPLFVFSPVRCSLFVSFLFPASMASTVPTCTSRRPGGGSVRDFRTLYIPQAFLDAANASAVAAHSGRLCCVYTRTTLTNRDRPYLVTYDNNERAVDGASFEQAADSAFNAMCNMGMTSHNTHLNRPVGNRVSDKALKLLLLCCLCSNMRTVPSNLGAIFCGL